MIRQNYSFLCWPQIVVGDSEGFVLTGSANSRTKEVFDILGWKVRGARLVHASSAFHIPFSRENDGDSTKDGLLRRTQRILSRNPKAEAHLPVGRCPADVRKTDDHVLHTGEHVERFFFECRSIWFTETKSRKGCEWLAWFLHGLEKEQSHFVVERSTGYI